MTINTNQCSICGIEWQGLGKSQVCARCQHTPTPPSLLVDAPPMPTAEIEAIKVAMLQTGWVLGGDT